MNFKEMPHEENHLLRLLTALEAPDMVFAVISSSSNLNTQYLEDRAKFRKILDNDRRRNSQLVNLADDFGLSFMRIAGHNHVSEAGEKISDNSVLIETVPHSEAFLMLFCDTAAQTFNQESYLFKASSGKVSLCFPDAPDSDLGVFTSDNFTEFMYSFIASRNSVLKNDRCFLRDGMSFELIPDNTPKLRRGQYSWQLINGRTDYLREHHCFPRQ